MESTLSQEVRGFGMRRSHVMNFAETVSNRLQGSAKERLDSGVSARWVTTHQEPRDTFYRSDIGRLLLLPVTAFLRIDGRMIRLAKLVSIGRS